MTSLYVMVPLSFLLFLFLKARNFILIFLEASKAKEKISPYKWVPMLSQFQKVSSYRETFQSSWSSDRPICDPTHSDQQTVSLTSKETRQSPGKVTCNHDHSQNCHVRGTCLLSFLLLSHSINLKDFVMALILATSQAYLEHQHHQSQNLGPTSWMNPVIMQGYLSSGHVCLVYNTASSPRTISPPKIFSLIQETRD